jgi:Rne/Rng family ribonuclease
MNKELYVSSTPHETKVALVEDDQLAEVFFERENEYTLAGSIYKGRVTRVLPGMQSAFVDIGLERDAFLYVSDFLDLPSDGEGEDEEFGQIPAPRTTVDVGHSHPTEEAQGQSETAFAEEEADFESALEEFAAPGEEQSGADNGEASGGEDRDSRGARRWRGRRRRGGRRGRPDERDDRPAPGPGPKLEAAKPPEETPTPRAESRPAVESRPRADYGPPAGYTPIVLPGESISKYRNLGQQPAVEPQEVKQEEAPANEDFAAAVIEDFTPPASSWAEPTAASERTEEHPSAEPAQVTAGPQELGLSTAVAEELPPPVKRRWRTPRGKLSTAPEVAALVAPRAPEATLDNVDLSSPEHSFAVQAPEAIETAPSHTADSWPQHEPEDVVEDEAEVENHSAEFRSASAELDLAQHTVGTATHDLQHLTPPEEAPAGHTLEHEVLEDEEMEFAPVPDDLGALSEVAGDEELILEEETLDAGNGPSERWIPKIEDVDEDEVVAAEMRGENIYDADSEEEEEDAGEPEETNGRAELRAAPPTAGYQQRQQERPGYNRQYRDRNRRGGPRRGMRARPNNNRNMPLISDLLKEGQEILVQIAKEPIGKKGARITSHIALPGRFLVYMPTVNHIGVSRKIASEEERLRLKRIVTSERENGLGGFIVRTAAANIKEDELRADIRFLKHLWAEIKNRGENDKSPALIYHDLNLVERVLRDQVNADFSQIWVDTEDEYERVVRFSNRFQPSLVRRIKLYTKDAPLFEQFGIQEEIDRSLKSKVWLKSGGYLVINQTEALVAIDINTGKYVGKTQRLEDTIVKTNVDAVKEIVRQVRLRDLGGIIIIDFIDMDERKNRQRVMQALEEALRSDRAPSKVLQFNDFGLVAITRKRVKQSLERTLGEPCPYCTGAGFVKSVPTVCNEIYIEMRKMAKVHDKTDITLRVNPEVAKALKANNGKLIGEMEDLTGKTVLVKSDASLHQEHFDIH